MGLDSVTATETELTLHCKTVDLVFQSSMTYWMFLSFDLCWGIFDQRGTHASFHFLSQ